MSHITLPYNLSDGQKAYAARVMADLEALAGQLNRVSVEGLIPGDLESVLLQLKLLLDETAAAEGRGVQELRLDTDGPCLELRLRDGAVFQADLSDCYNDYQGSESPTVAVNVDGSDHIRAEVRPGSIGSRELAAGVLSLIDGKITAGAAGSAADVRFSDGQSFQDKLDAGLLKGADGVSAVLESLYCFRYDPDSGHLFVGVADGGSRPPFSINGEGHLIYTID